MNGNYDYVVIGAGSAGCVLAKRLTDDGTTRVLLLEAGGNDDAFYMQMPSGYGKIIGDPRYDWCYNSGPEPYLGGRKLFTPRGKALGGSSSTNGMAYVRGHRQDFENWHDLGNPGWSWQDVLPVFKRIENYHGAISPVRSTTGAMHVTTIKGHPLSLRLMQAAAEAGLPTSLDYNDGDPIGLGLIQMNTWKGRRFSSSQAYLKPAKKRRNLTIVTHAETTRVRFDGRTAIGVEYRHGGQEIPASATREVILCAGSINSPKLLELSGIGNPALLAQHGIPVIAALRGVGENLQDHYNIGIKLKLRDVGSLNEELRGMRKMMHGIRYVLTRGGLLAESPAQVTGYAKVMESAPSADIQLWGMPGSVVVKKGSKGENRLVMDEQPGISLSFDQNRPRSRGFSHIRSSDPKIPPTIVNNYLRDPLDCEVAALGLRLCRRILDQSAFDKYRNGTAGPDEIFKGDANLIDYARQAGRSSYHLVGTCSMGLGPDSVVDSCLRVRGIDHLRVIDSSVMPAIVSGNTHAATVMIAEKGADLVLESAK